MENIDFIMDKAKAKTMQPLVLAMIGDSVQTLFVRTYIADKFGVKVNKMNKMVSSVVKAGSQFKTFKKIEESLTEEEQDVARRYAEYIYATALEALIGYLHLTGEKARLNQILTLSLEELEAE